MAAPTRVQIEADVALPTYLVEFYSGSTWTSIANANVVSLTGSVETGSSDNGLAFGILITPRCTFESTDDTVSLDWELLKIRVSFGFDTSDKVKRFEGVIIGRTRNQRKVTYECSGFSTYIERTKIYTPVFYYRPVATKTSVSSVEDPDGVGYRAGLLNRIMWESGGRPYEQVATYPAARFYYSFDESIIRPKWSWLNGENGWAEAERLVRAVGGQLFQASDGVIYYKQPLTFGQYSGTPFTIDSSYFSTITENNVVLDLATKVSCPFAERDVKALQDVYDNTTSYLIEPSEVRTIIIETDLPTKEYINTSGTFPASIVKATYFDGRVAAPTITNGDLNAQHVELYINNTSAEPICVDRITIQGYPIAVGYEGSTSFGAGDVELQIENSVYIQTEVQAYRLCAMVYDSYNVSHSIITLENCGFDPDRYVGEVVSVTYAPYSLSSTLCRITGISFKNTGALMDMDVVILGDLPTRDDVFITGTLYENSDVRMVAY